MKARKSDFERMSDQLRAELVASINNGDLLFVPSPEVRAEAIRFIRPKSDTLTFVNITAGSGKGLDGDGRMTGIGMAKSFVDQIRGMELQQP